MLKKERNLFLTRPNKESISLPKTSTVSYRQRGADKVITADMNSSYITALLVSALCWKINHVSFFPLCAPVLNNPVGVELPQCYMKITTTSLASNQPYLIRMGTMEGWEGGVSKGNSLANNDFLHQGQGPLMEKVIRAHATEMLEVSLLAKLFPCYLFSESRTK